MSRLTATDIISAATECLTLGGYRNVTPKATEKGWSRVPSRLFEDPYSVVGVVVFDTWLDLKQNWVDAQADLVETISDHVGPSEPKAWDGYLALFTPAIPPAEDSRFAQIVRYDTTRLRKLLATGNELTTLAGVEDTLLPLLPFSEAASSKARESTLDLLPELLAKRGLEVELIRELVKAFLDQRPLIDVLYKEIQS